MSELTKSLHAQVTAEPPLLAVPPSPSLEPAAETTPHPGKKKYRKPLAGAAMVVVLCLAVGIIVWTRQGAAPQPTETMPTAVVERRDFLRTLRITGTVEAVRSHAITAPRVAGAQLGNNILTRLIPAGARVKKGDVLAEFDRQGQIQNFLDAKAAYQDLVDQIAQKRADEAAARAKDDTELKQAEDDLAKAKLEIQKNEIVARIDAEKNRLTLEQAAATVKQLQATYALKRRAAAADIHDFEIQRDAKRLAMMHAQQNEEKMIIHSPADGIVVLNSIWKGNGMGEAAEGDQLWGGVPFMQIVNPGAMEVQVAVNQVDQPYLHAGQSTEVRLDAYPGAVFSGKVEDLAPIAVAGEFSEKVRDFAAVISIEGTDPRLMPDLSAAVDVELERLPQVLLAPLDAVVSENGRHYVWIEGGGSGSEKREVKTGPANDTEIVIESGVQVGDRLLRNRQAHKQQRSAAILAANQAGETPALQQQVVDAQEIVETAAVGVPGGDPHRSRERKLRYGAMDP